MSAVNLAARLALFSEHWQPRTVAQFNGHDIMVVKAKGEFVWHHHADTDDLFLVLQGRLTIQLRDRDVHLLIMERAGTPNTGDATTAAPRRAI